MSATTHIATIRAGMAADEAAARQMLGERYHTHHCADDAIAVAGLDHLLMVEHAPRRDAADHLPFVIVRRVGE